MLGSQLACSPQANVRGNVSEPTAHTADQAYQDKEWDRVERLYSYLEARDSDNSIYPYRLGVAASHRGDLKQAQAHFDRALVLDPALQDARYNLAMVHLNIAYKELKNLDVQVSETKRRLQIRNLTQVLERLATMR